MTHKRKKHNFILHYFNDFGKYCKSVIIGIVFDTLNRVILKNLGHKKFRYREFETTEPFDIADVFVLFVKKTKTTVVEIYFRICYEAINLKKIN